MIIKVDFFQFNKSNYQTKYDTDELAQQNQQRLKKLRDLEGTYFVFCLI